MRQGLNVESGLNDGICVPLLLIAIAIAEAEEGAIGDGAAVQLVLEEIGYGCLGGVDCGTRSRGRGQGQESRAGLVDPIWLQVVPVAGGRARLRPGGVDGRQRVHRRVRRGRRLRRACVARSEAR